MTPRRSRRPWRLVALEDRLAPAALLPDLHVLANNLNGWFVTTAVSGAREIRFDTSLANIGQGAFELRGTPTIVTDASGVQRQTVNQRVFNSDSTFTDRNAGYFLYHPTHSHVHFDDMAWAQLRIRTPGDGLGDIVAVGEKTSFCLLDSTRISPVMPGSPANGVYNVCGTQVQGISLGWYDTYHDGLDGQAIDITGVPNGNYWLEVVADPMNHILELNETNNVSRVAVTLNSQPSYGFRVLSASPAGGTNDPVGFVELNFNEAVNMGTFTDADLTMNGPGGVIPITGVTPVDSVTVRVNFALQSAVGTYTLNVGPNIMSMSGRTFDQNNNGTGGQPGDVFFNIFALPAPRVAATTPAGAVTGPVSSVRVTYNKPLDASTFTLADVVSFTGPNGVDLRPLITSVIPSATGGPSAAFDIAIPSQSANGLYTLVLEPNVADPYGHAADQNGDGVSDANDRYTATFFVTPAAAVGPDGFAYDAKATPVQSLGVLGTTGAVPITFTGTDDAATAISLGNNTFNFYGTTYTGANQLFVSTNGLISFGEVFIASSVAAYANDDLTTTDLPVIAALWDDWERATGNPQGLYRIDDTNMDGTADRLVVEWNRVRHTGGSSTNTNNVTFQVALELNTGMVPGRVTFNYADLLTGDGFANGLSATVGMRAGGATGARLLVSRNGTSSLVGNNRAIQIAVPTVSSIIRQDLSVSPAGEVSYLVTFTHPVIGVDESDFSLATTGNIAGAHVEHIHPTSDPAVYEVHVLTGVGSGLLRLDLADDGSIRSTFGAPLAGPGAVNGSYARGEIYDIIQPPPKVEAFNIGDGLDQRSDVNQITVAFDYPVTFNGDPALAFRLTNAVTQALVDVTVDLSASTDVHTVARLTFTGAGSDGGSLADGRYNLTILSSRVSAGGVALDGNGDGTAGDDYTAPASARLYRLFGDADGNGAVDLLDLQAFRSTFNASSGNPAYLSYLDYDGGGVVDLVDLTAFRDRFNVTV